ncbi:GNAT family N-acetyltransferase [Mycolicibacterium flavescens]|uniref:GNAT family N-acetyltransferase n=1 Tax=Mycolicibacterium flavescens TaxID=1776 RepID=A0A1E3REQ8_MYCFV|nr:GNAT family N-acetyltransferase [Mycolicibacterium flavescens]MCV7282352.1 GNAT family N-acetyltransferase [Mycolicibacterium flavescens]ODQ87887.1 GNAT family N-acetyltransferase [Mycolicibacterium flavescens]
MKIAQQLPRTQGDIVVRRLSHGDAAAFAAGTEDPAVRQYGHLPLPEYSEQIVRDQIDGVIADGLADDSLAVLAIADASSDRFLGSIVLFDFIDARAEVGFWLCPEARGRGAARQALTAAAGLASAAGLTHLTARTVPENDGSRRALESAGFTWVDGPHRVVTPSGSVTDVLDFELPVV